MKFNILHLLLVVSISGVIGDGTDIIINGSNNSIPAASTVPNLNPTSDSPPEPTTPSTEGPTTRPTTKHTTPAPTSTPSTSPTPTTTPHPPVPPSTNSPSSTENTPTVPTAAPSHRGRHFDGPSFIGGIILASGLMAICFVSWKFYKARTERNYHTL